ncbi:uncharacterized protein LOC119935606 [Tachyglossus aculeatus]|uniref:uncharacterized protein LOC119935606 n=1 Tax=Tachyglossus aculeatus TaxID=9261 RepID=UPI0018F31969|nr:uncharacterized protein LOC119935606 [Tachyglossus aculeatus]
MEASLTCAVCLELLDEPVTLPSCSHNFCKKCVTEWASARRPVSEAAAPGPRPLVCPLCQKPCPLAHGGRVTDLPVNSTLAQVVELFKVGERPPGPSSPWGRACGQHPGMSSQLFCRSCCFVGCGLCVVNDHQGVFHSIGSLDSAYQEEKLAFYCSLKQLRTTDEELKKKISSNSNANESEATIIETEFEKISQVLEMRKKQLLEKLERQRNMKEHQIWKKMDNNKNTIENYLQECEKLIDEVDPQRFLEVACDLNKRVKSHLELMHLASSSEKEPEFKNKQVCSKAVIKEILALELTEVDLDNATDFPNGRNKDLNGKFVFKTASKKWKLSKDCRSFNYHPVLGSDVLQNGQICFTRFMSISFTEKFENMSHEELRLQYYEIHQKDACDQKTESFSENPSSSMSSVPKFAKKKTKSPKKMHFSSQTQERLAPTSDSDICNRKGLVANSDFPALNLDFGFGTRVQSNEKTQLPSLKNFAAIPAKSFVSSFVSPRPAAAELPLTASKPNDSEGKGSTSTWSASNSASAPTTSPPSVFTFSKCKTQPHKEAHQDGCDKATSDCLMIVDSETPETSVGADPDSATPGTSLPFGFQTCLGSRQKSLFPPSPSSSTTRTSEPPAQGSLAFRWGSQMKGTVITVGAEKNSRQTEPAGGVCDPNAKVMDSAAAAAGLFTGRAVHNDSFVSLFSRSCDLDSKFPGFPFSFKPLASPQVTSAGVGAETNLTHGKNQSVDPKSPLPKCSVSVSPGALSSSMACQEAGVPNTAVNFQGKPNFLFQSVIFGSPVGTFPHTAAQRKLGTEKMYRKVAANSSPPDDLKGVSSVQPQNAKCPTVSEVAEERAFKGASPKEDSQ